jgi:hypothetical protein
MGRVSRSLLRDRSKAIIVRAVRKTHGFWRQKARGFSAKNTEQLFFSTYLCYNIYNFPTQQARAPAEARRECPLPEEQGEQKAPGGRILSKAVFFLQNIQN